MGHNNFIPKNDLSQKKMWVSDFPSNCLNTIATDMEDVIGTENDMIETLILDPYFIEIVYEKRENGTQ